MIKEHILAYFAALSYMYFYVIVMNLIMKRYYTILVLSSILQSSGYRQDLDFIMTWIPARSSSSNLRFK